MTLTLELTEIADTSPDQLLCHANGARSQLKLKREPSPFAPHLGRDQLSVTFYHEGKSYAASVDSILQAFIAQHTPGLRETIVGNLV